MTKVAATITTSIDGYITGPNDGPGQGLGEGGERLHYWVFGGPWTYAAERRGEPTGADKEWRSRTRGRSSAGAERTRPRRRGAGRTHDAFRSSSSRTGRRTSRPARASRS